MSGRVEMGEVVPYRPADATRRTTAYIGMIIFVAAWAMMFSCLFFAYAALRVGLGAWPPIGEPELPLLVPGLNTAVILLSSLALEVGIYGLRRGHRGGLAPALAFAALLGAGFVLLQVMLGLELAAAGLTIDAGAYGAVVYGLAGIHVAHVLVGLVALVVLFVQALRGRYNIPQHLPVRLWAIYWHFVGVVWVLMFVGVFVL